MYGIDYSDEYTGNIEDYYMVDFLSTEQGRIRWVREQMVHKDKLTSFLQSLVFGVGKGQIKNLRILPEEFLSRKRNAEWLEDEEEYKKDTITNRQHLFGDIYESGVQNLTRNHNVKD